MKISIIIPHANRKEYLRMCLKALFVQNFSKEDYQIIVVGEMPDDIEVDGGCNFVYVPVTLEEGEALCLSRFRNLGAQKAQGEVLVFLDCDILVSQNFLKNTWDELWDENKLVFVVRNNIPEGVVVDQLTDLKHIKCIKDEREIVHRLFDTDYSKIESIWMWAASHTLSMHRKEFFESGCFSEEFTGWGAEDTEFGYRLYKKGIPIVCDTKSKCYHLWHGDPVEYNKKKFDEAARNIDIFRNIHTDSVLEAMDIAKMCSSLGTGVRLNRYNINPLVYMYSLIEMFVRGFNANSTMGDDKDGSI